MGNHQARLGPEGLPQPLGFLDLDFLLFLMISSRHMLRGSDDIFAFKTDGDGDGDGDGVERDEGAVRERGLRDFKMRDFRM